MKVSTLFERLSFGELANLPISQGQDKSLGSGEIAEKHWMRLLTFTNAGLKILCGRFPLVTKDLILEQRQGITHYHLDRAHAEFGSRGRVGKPLYIKDLPCEPFEGDVLRILSAFDRHGRLDIDDEGRLRSIFTQRVTEIMVIQVPRPVQSEPIALTYQTYHRQLCLQRTDPQQTLDQVIHVPPYLEEALQYYVASRVYEGNASEDAMVKADLYRKKAESLCQEAENLNLLGTSVSTTNHKLHERGYV